MSTKNLSYARAIVPDGVLRKAERMVTSTASIVVDKHEGWVRVREKPEHETGYFAPSFSFDPEEARHIAALLLKMADVVERERADGVPMRLEPI